MSPRHHCDVIQNITMMSTNGHWWCPPCPWPPVVAALPVAAGGGRLAHGHWWWPPCPWPPVMAAMPVAAGCGRLARGRRWRGRPPVAVSGGRHGGRPPVPVSGGFARGWPPVVAASGTAPSTAGDGNYARGRLAATLLVAVSGGRFASRRWWPPCTVVAGGVRPCLWSPVVATLPVTPIVARL
ncbi:Hypothetical predicted protein [Cloeon dipterum]|uniref:Uncharacterized protein n=1 Tax=Cloeon dipterum TaxID=197152 RepID=A0A8S1DXZ9_9INSE|nr:Hypothetical predicted protein [Cloeon dipterum]